MRFSPSFIAAVTTLCLGGMAHASPGRKVEYPESQCVISGKTVSGRKALIVANTDYNIGALSNPKNDADLIRDQLVLLDFEVVVCKDLSASEIDASVDAFIDHLESSDLALFYYAGHGSEIDGTNYMVGVDYLPRRPRLTDLQRVLRQFSLRDNTGVSIAIFDACRTDPTRPRTQPVGFAGEVAGAGTFVAFSTSVGAPASDGLANTNSPFALAFADAIKKHAEDDIGILFRYITRDTLAATKKNQRPWTTSSLDGLVVLKPMPAPMASNTTTSNGRNEQSAPSGLGGRP